jgi:hypothetical protein
MPSIFSVGATLALFPLERLSRCQVGSPFALGGCEVIGMDRDVPVGRQLLQRKPGIAAPKSIEEFRKTVAPEGSDARGNGIDNGTEVLLPSAQL